MIAAPAVCDHTAEATVPSVSKYSDASVNDGMIDVAKIIFNYSPWILIVEYLLLSFLFN